MTIIQKITQSRLPEAEAAYQQRRESIVEYVKRLGALLDNHLKPGERIDWGHVGDLGHIEEVLGDLLDED